ncbi:hypothetical protein J4460_05485 [Candidatus Woesearchaeota archaeon]|nr:MAG: hypothetical protein QS99_C0015G0010 [archaeon GW2011_AR4]MBS3130098.1 hypothetical protein [Candidatus Woesearchaeota archaeon]HIH38715.1 hypothetical protein [Candidatus Woesearchaeota archaeon]HIH49303.1 hypothetical protein [Candidatus Woesearchaeota archaeon]HIJ03643.1 hypothetical protein [Candidatus Woesearchaeota archaeon]
MKEYQETVRKLKKLDGLMAFLSIVLVFSFVSFFSSIPLYHQASPLTGLASENESAQGDYSSLLSIPDKETLASLASLLFAFISGLLLAMLVAKRTNLKTQLVIKEDEQHLSLSPLDALTEFFIITYRILEKNANPEFAAGAIQKVKADLEKDHKGIEGVKLLFNHKKDTISVTSSQALDWKTLADITHLFLTALHIDEKKFVSIAEYEQHHDFVNAFERLMRKKKEQ